MQTATKVGISAAVLSTIAAATAAYMYVGKEAPKRRQKEAAWMKRAEKDIVKEAMKLRDSAFTEQNFNRIVKMVTEKYRQAQSLSADDVGRFIAMISEAWQKAGNGSTWSTGTGTRRTKKTRASTRPRTSST